LGAVPALVDEKRELSRADVFASIKAWTDRARRRWAALPFGSEERKLVSAVKNALVAADIAGSALPRLSEAPAWEWITKSFADKPNRGDLQSVVEERRKGFNKTEPQREQFQNAVADSTARVTFVKAGCGSGKTLAAYMWAAKNH